MLVSGVTVSQHTPIHVELKNHELQFIHNLEKCYYSDMLILNQGVSH